MQQPNTPRFEPYLGSPRPRRRRSMLRALRPFALLLLLGPGFACSHSAADEKEGGCGGTCRNESDCEGATSCIETSQGSRCLPSACRGCDRVCQYREEVIGSVLFCSFDGCE